MKRTLIMLLVGMLATQTLSAQQDTTTQTHDLKQVVVKATKGIKARYRVDNTDLIGQGQLIRAACCNLGESFTTNPSVDVSYRSPTDKTPWTQRHLCPNAHRKHTQSARRSTPLQSWLCARTLDAVDTGEQGGIERQKRI